MRIYLAARYSRRLELCGYREQLRAKGHVVDAVWLNGEHQIDEAGKPIGESGESLVEGVSDPSTNVVFRPGERLSPDRVDEEAARLRQKFAREDWRDVANSQLLIAFTEQPRSGASRGGRHVELGLGLGLGIDVMIVGPRENIFCWLPDILQFDTWEECLSQL